VVKRDARNPQPNPAHLPWKWKRLDGAVGDRPALRATAKHLRNEHEKVGIGQEVDQAGEDFGPNSRASLANFKEFGDAPLLHPDGRTDLH
jgi:hypothetical protein